MSKKKVFLSFDFESDIKLKESITKYSELPDSPFEIVSYTSKLTGSKTTWKALTESAIKGAHIAIVMVGACTHKIPEVLDKERIARKSKLKIIQIVDYKHIQNTPEPVHGAGKLYRWDWHSIKNLLR